MKLQQIRIQTIVHSLQSLIYFSDYYNILQYALSESHRSAYIDCNSRLSICFFNYIVLSLLRLPFSRREGSGRSTLQAIFRGYTRKMNTMV